MEYHKNISAKAQIYIKSIFVPFNSDSAFPVFTALNFINFNTEGEYSLTAVFGKKFSSYSI